MRYLIAAPDGTLVDWQARCVEHLTKAGARAVGLIAAERTHSEGRSLFWSCAVALSRPGSLRLSAGGMLGDLPRVRSIEELGGEAVDFVLDFSDDSADQPTISHGAKFGRWRFVFAQTPAGAPPGAGDVAAGREVARAALVANDGRGGATAILVRGAIGVERTFLARHVDSLLYEVARWPAHACGMLQASNDVWAARASEDGSLDRSLFEDIAPTAGLGAAAGYLARTVGAICAGIGRRFFFSSSWNMGVARAPIESFARDGRLPDVVWYPKSDVPRFAADPFGISSDGRNVVLCESLFPGRDGTICSTSFDGAAWASELTPSLELPFHLSYPYVFERDGVTYCVPEASASGEIALYRASRFPAGWEKCATLVSGFGGVDSSLVQFGGRWWMFTGDIADGADHKLWIFHAEDLFGPWAPHTRNPVKIDVRSSRGAGTPFVVDGVLYRPSQDCSQTYGGRVIVNRVLKLSPTEFEEERARVVEPQAGGAYRFGLHTLSRFGAFTLIDGKQRYVSLSWAARAAKRPFAALRRGFVKR